MKKKEKLLMILVAGTFILQSVFLCGKNVYAVENGEKTVNIAETDSENNGKSEKNENVKKNIYPSENKSGIYSVSSVCPPDIIGESAILVDMSTGYTIYEKNIYDKKYPASITKIMTAMLTLENTQMDQVVTFSHKAVYSVEPGSSAAYVDENEQLTVEQCLYGLMLISGNDLANGLAEFVGGSMENFADMMTKKAKSIGCVNTNFTNAHGLHDENHYTCAYDMASIGREAYNNYAAFRKICGTVTYDCPPTNIMNETRVWLNNNKLINPVQKEYYADCVGGKTGFTNQAGGTFVSYANINGRLLMCVILKSTNSAGAYEDAKALYEYARANVSQSVYEGFDKKAEENANKNQTVDKNNESQTPPSTENNEKNKGDKVTSSEEKSTLGIGIKIIIFLFTAFIIYYIYIKYTRYKKRQARRKRREMEREN